MSETEPLYDPEVFTCASEFMNWQGPIRVIRSNGNVYLGVYDQERAAEVFEELLVSLANGDNLFRMPEK